MPCKWPTGCNLLALGVIQDQHLDECALLVSLSLLHFNWRHSLLGGESVLLSEVTWAPGRVTESFGRLSGRPASGPVCAGHGVQRGHRVDFFPEVPSPSPHCVSVIREAALPAGRSRISCVLRENPRARTRAAVRESHQQAITALLLFFFFFN